MVACETSHPHLTMTPLIAAGVRARQSKHTERRIKRYGVQKIPGMSRVAITAASALLPPTFQSVHHDAQAFVPRCMAQTAVNAILSGTERSPPPRRRRKRRRGGKGALARRRLRRRPVIAPPRNRVPPVVASAELPPGSSSVKRSLARGPNSAEDSRGQRIVFQSSARYYRKLVAYLAKSEHNHRIHISVYPGLPQRQGRMIVLRSPPPPGAPRPPNRGWVDWPWPPKVVLGRPGAASTGRPDLQWRKCKSCGSHYQGERKGLCEPCARKGKSSRGKKGR
jgi:hypothetical protein